MVRHCEQLQCVAGGAIWSASGAVDQCRRGGPYRIGAGCGLDHKFTHGAYLVVIAMPALFALMKAISRHYRRVGEELAPGPGGISMPSRIHAVVLLSRLDQPTLQALAYAKRRGPIR